MDNIDDNENYIIDYLNGINENSKCVSYLGSSLQELLELFMEKVQYTERVFILIKMIDISNNYIKHSMETKTYQIVSKVLWCINKIEHLIPDTTFGDDYKRFVSEKISQFKIGFKQFYHDILIL